MSIMNRVQEILAANPGVSWNDLVLRQLRTALSSTDGGVTDLWMRWFAGQGFITGSLQDRMKAYWDSNSVPLNERNLFYLGVRAFFSIGPELVTNGDFATDTVWTKGTGWTIASGVATATNASGTLSQSIPALTPGLTYRVEYTLTLVSGSVNIQPNLGSTVATSRSASGTYSQNIVHAGATTLTFVIVGQSGTSNIDNVSVRQV